MLRREDMQRRLTDLRNGLVASDTSTLKLSTSFSGQRRCMFFDIGYKMILNHLRKVNVFAKKIILYLIFQAKIKEIKFYF